MADRILTPEPEYPWLAKAATEYLVATVFRCKQELLRRGLDECGVEMPLLRSPFQAAHVSAADRVRARAIVDEQLILMPVPLKAHHDCPCPRDRQFHLDDCIVAQKIREAARQDVISTIEQEPVRTVLIRVRGGAVEVDSE